MSKHSLQYIKSNVGKVFTFTLIKQLPIAGKNCYLIEDAEQSRFILPARYYLNYGFSIGDIIQCRLDRINCKGELFFEPLHPFYKTGEAYSFDFVSTKEVKHIHGFNETVRIVRDKFGCEHFVRYSNNGSAFNGNSIFYIWSIRKGKMLLLPINKGEPIFKLNEFYDFKIECEYNTDRLGAGFLLVDEYGTRHVISRNHYMNYNLKVGDTIWCSIKGNSSKGYFHLEPKHPVYELGEQYEFELFNYIIDQTSIHYFVLDCYGQIVKVKAEKETMIKLRGEMLKCRVLDFNKGLPELEYISWQ